MTPTVPVTFSEAMRPAELADSHHWIDSFTIPRDHIKKELGLEASWDGEMSMVNATVPHFHFNMAAALSGVEPNASTKLESITEFFKGREHHITVVEPFNSPQDLNSDDAHRLVELNKSLIAARGYQPLLSVDRVLLDQVTPALLAQWEAQSQGAELVTPALAVEWSEFVTRTYQMPPLVAEWLQSMVGRPGWYHAVCRKEDGTVAMARSAYVYEENHWGFLGIDAPVPVLMAPCFDDDAKVTAFLMKVAALEGGAKAFVSDLEVPNEERSGPDYAKWQSLGFEIAYKRQVYKWVSAQSQEGAEAQLK